MKAGERPLSVERMADWTEGAVQMVGRGVTQEDVAWKFRRVCLAQRVGRSWLRASLRSKELQLAGNIGNSLKESSVSNRQEAAFAIRRTIGQNGIPFCINASVAANFRIRSHAHIVKS